MNDVKHIILPIYTNVCNEAIEELGPLYLEYDFKAKGALERCIENAKKLISEEDISNTTLIQKIWEFHSHVAPLTVKRARNKFETQLINHLNK